MNILILFFILVKRGIRNPKEVLYYLTHPRIFFKKAAAKYISIKTLRKYRFKEKNNFMHRNYENYGDYLKHQKSKFVLYRGEIEKKFEEKSNNLKNDFEKIENFSQKNVLCLGSRDGAEVKAFRDLGSLCVGIDLVYPENNPYVHFGDFHQIPYPEKIFEFVYTNALDHLYDANSLFSEVKRVMKKDGIFIVNIIKGYSEGFNLTEEYESLAWSTKEELRKLIKENGFTFIKEIKIEGSELWTHNLFKINN